MLTGRAGFSEDSLPLTLSARLQAGGPAGLPGPRVAALVGRIAVFAGAGAAMAAISAVSCHMLGMGTAQPEISATAALFGESGL